MDSIRAHRVHIINRELINHARCEVFVNRAEIAASNICACVVCGQYFFAEEIKRYNEHGSAICPFCGYIAVLPDSCHLPMSPGFLRLVRDGLRN